MERGTQNKFFLHYLQIGNQKLVCAVQNTPLCVCVYRNMSGIQQADSPSWLQPHIQNCLGKLLCPQIRCVRVGSQEGPGQPESWSSHHTAASCVLETPGPHMLQPGVRDTTQMPESESVSYIPACRYIHTFSL